ncbi:MAG: serine/threonine-protein kinase [Myxococcota bacterium]
MADLSPATDPMDPSPDQTGPPHHEGAASAATSALPEDETRELPRPPPVGSRPSEVPSRDINAPTDTCQPRPNGSSGALATDQQFGRFTVLGTVGRGGMGTVYEAFDRVLDRRVAVKVLHRDVEAHHQLRLVREAQALAQLSHPNVVQVYEVGEVEGRHFVAMEFIHGRTLRQWLRQEPRPDWRACIEIYLQAGAGLAAAHAQGLVHRDFKPSNAIVDAQGRVKVLDFGLARAIEGATEDDERPPLDALASRPLSEGPGAHTQLTETGVVVGTLAYMSPEQMLGQELDARSDQFSLCVALYEAVYGERPFPRSMAAVKFMRSMATRAVLPAPKHAKFPAAGRRILLRGLAVDPTQRWPSMNALLTELRTLVTPRRHRWVSLGILGIMVALGANAVYRTQTADERCTGAHAQLDGVWDDTTRYEVETALLGTARPYAADTWERVDAALGEYTRTWVAKHTEICKATRVTQDQSEDAMDLRMGCLGQSKVAVRAVATVLARADDQVVDKAVDLVTGLPDLSRCDDLPRLLEQRQRVPPPRDPQIAAQVDTLRERLEGIAAERDAGRVGHALEQIEPVLQSATSLEYGPLHAQALRLRGELHQQAGHPSDAELDLRRAHAIAVRHGAQQVALEAASGLTYVVGYQSARYAEGLVWGQTALPLAEYLGEPMMLAKCLDHMGTVYGLQGKYEEAETLLRRALQATEQARGADHPDVTSSLQNLGIVLSRRGKHEEANALLRRALQIDERTLGKDHPHVAADAHNLAAELQLQGRYAQSEALLRRALGIYERAMGKEHPDVALILNNLAPVLAGRGHHQEAEAMLRRALRIQERALGPEHPHVADTVQNLGNARVIEQDYVEAQALLRRALQIYERTLDADHPAVANSAQSLGSLLNTLGRYDQAHALLLRSQQIYERALGADDPHVADALVGLADNALARGALPDARVHAQRATAIREQSEQDPQRVAEARFVLARVLGHDPTQRSRARELALSARDAYAAGGDHPGDHDALARIDAWLAKHRVE